MDAEKIEITLPFTLLKRIDHLVELIGFDTRDELILSAIRRFLDKFMMHEVEVC